MNSNNIIIEAIRHINNDVAYNDYIERDVVYNNGIMRGFSLGGGYTTQYDIELPKSKDFDFCYINTKGTGNNGDLVAIPKTVKAKRLRRLGAIIHLVREYEMEVLEAARFEEARRKAGVSFGNEKGVITLARAIINGYSRGYLAVIPEWDYSISHSRWVAKHDLPPQGDLSAWRYQAAYKIARKYFELNG